jgi:hypothetical protein
MTGETFEHIEDEHDTETLREVTQPVQELGMGRDITARAQNRFDEHRRYGILMGSQEGSSVFEVIERQDEHVIDCVMRDTGRCWYWHGPVRVASECEIWRHADGDMIGRAVIAPLKLGDFPRPVNTRAARIANSTASVPLLVKRICSTEGSRAVNN